MPSFDGRTFLSRLFRKSIGSHSTALTKAYAVLLEEVRELEHVVFFGEKEAKKEAAEKQFIASNSAYYIHKERLREEAIQIAAMAARIIQELT